MESTEIVKSSSVLVRSVDDLGRIGKMLAVSGYFEDAADIAKSSVKVMAGMEMGFGPFASMTGIHIIKGKPAVGANLMAAAVKANPRYDYRVRKMEDDEVILDFFERIDGKLEKIGTSTFSAKDAQRAGTQNMGRFPRNMLFARAISNGIRWYCPDVFSGNATYIPEELGAVVDDDGNITEIPEIQQPEAQQEVIEAEATPIPAEQPAPAEQAAAQPQKKPFDEMEFLRSFSKPAAVMGMSKANAESYTAADGTPYKDMTTKELYGHWVGLSRKHAAETDPVIKDGIALSIAAICEILQNRKLEKTLPQTNDNPFVTRPEPQP